MYQPEKWQKDLERTSAIAVSPKRAFLDWLEIVAVHHPLQWTAERLRQTREPIVWIIPSVGTFDSQGELDTYIDSLQQNLMRSEFQAMCSDESLWPPLAPGTFSEYFDLHIYPHVAASGYLHQ